MFGTYFYFETTRKYIILFGALFNDIVIKRFDDAGNMTQSIKVPVAFGSKEKMLGRIKQDPMLDQQAAIVLPQMTFLYHNPSYDGNRHINVLGRVVRKDDSDVNKFRYQYNPVPYNLSFSLYIYSKDVEDAAKIIEQILPYFTPEWQAQIEIIPELDIQLDVAVVLKSLSQEDFFEGPFVDRRTLVWTLNFDMQGYFYGPVKKAPVIKFANTNFYYGTITANTEAADTYIEGLGYVRDSLDMVQVSPGLTANGQPTTNANAAISPLLVDVDTNWDVVVKRSGLMIEFQE